MWLLMAVFLAAAAGYVLSYGDPARRLAAVMPGRRAGKRRPRSSSPLPPPSVGRWWAALSAWAAAYVVVGGVAGLLAGAACAAGVAVAVARRTPEAVRLARARIDADLPFAAELMAACLRSGSPVDAAAEVVAEAIGGPIEDRLRAVAGRLRLGAEPRAAWAALGRDPAGHESLERFGRTVARAAGTGAPLAALLERLAVDARARGRAEAASAARRVGVYAVAPLGLCFLPAFVLLGVVPVVAGLAADLQIFGLSTVTAG